jgi:hypothetical protein
MPETIGLSRIGYGSYQNRFGTEIRQTALFGRVFFFYLPHPNVRIATTALQSPKMALVCGDELETAAKQRVPVAMLETLVRKGAVPTARSLNAIITHMFKFDRERHLKWKGVHSLPADSDYTVIDQIDDALSLVAALLDRFPGVLIDNTESASDKSLNTLIVAIRASAPISLIDLLVEHGARAPKGALALSIELDPANVAMFMFLFVYAGASTEGLVLPTREYLEQGLFFEKDMVDRLEEAGAKLGFSVVCPDCKHTFIQNSADALAACTGCKRARTRAMYNN